MKSNLHTDHTLIIDELEIKELTSATIRCYPINNEETKQSINDKKDGKFAIFSKAY